MISGYKAMPQDIASSNAPDNSKAFHSKFSSYELDEDPVKLIPRPQTIRWEHKHIEITAISFIPLNNTDSHVLDKEVTQICKDYRIVLKQDNSYRIAFLTDKNVLPEGYIMEVTKKGINIKASTESGHYYALQTLRQLLRQKSDGVLQLELCRIEDHPAFPIRGYMIDVGRNFQTMASLKKQLDIMSKYKLNTFHWHLTDRPAWRIESKAYPQLVAPENHRPTRDPGKYYTYNDIRELISYARERQITIIPEIDMPGHSDSFVQAMGFRMESNEGMNALKTVLNEFFSEIPKEMAPMIHIGSDEIRIR
ncbi:family 20 glycosylhydrolase [Snuella lapsa]|uniref:beta-N-acetylhexosaminidase n=1 Tax=Snuella lapsa TaxID=870481 RepID=A0ABP6X0N4_9FLAO